MDKPKTTFAKQEKVCVFLNKIQMKFLEIGSLEIWMWNQVLNIWSILDVSDNLQNKITSHFHPCPYPNPPPPKKNPPKFHITRNDR